MWCHLWIIFIVTSCWLAKMDVKGIHCHKEFQGKQMLRAQGGVKGKKRIFHEKLHLLWHRLNALRSAHKNTFLRIGMSNSAFGIFQYVKTINDIKMRLLKIPTFKKYVTTTTSKKKPLDWILPLWLLFCAVCFEF